MKLPIAPAKGFKVVNYDEMAGRKPVAVIQGLNDDGTHLKPPFILVVVEDDTQTEDYARPILASVPGSLNTIASA